MAMEVRRKRKKADEKVTRIQGINRRIILDAALEVFSAYGFRGSTVDQIAAKAGMSKPNLLYYFPRKQDIYVTVLEDTLEGWLKPLADLDPNGDPVEELRRYITAKLKMSADESGSLAAVRQRDPARRTGDLGIPEVASKKPRRGEGRPSSATGSGRAGSRRSIPTT